MNFATHIVGDNTSVISRFGSYNGIIRPEKLLDVLCYNNTGGVLYMQVFEITNSLVPFGTVYTGGGNISVTGLTIGHTYGYSSSNTNNDFNITNMSQLIVFSTSGSSGTFVAQSTSVTLGGSPASLCDLNLVDLTVPNSASAPVAGSVPRFAFPVQSGLGGTLGRAFDMQGVYCVWSTTPLTLTAVVAASGPIQIILKA